MISSKSIYVAIADDHTILRKGVISIINSFEKILVTIEASNGKELIEKIENSAQHPDVCILDINMPVLNGYETANYIKTNWPDIKILALSMYDNEYSIIQMLRSGAQGYIAKHTDPSILADAIRCLYHNSYYCSDLVSGTMIHNLKHNDLQHTITDSEMSFLTLCGSDLTYKQIGEKMCLSPRTIESYRDSLFQKLNIKSRASLVVFANSIGLNFHD